MGIQQDDIAWYRETEHWVRLEILSERAAIVDSPQSYRDGRTYIC